MEITFDKQYLSELYYKGKCSDKRHRYQPQIVKGYIRCLNLLEAMLSMEEIFAYHSFHYEILKGDKQGISSMRVNDQYRIEFLVRQNNSKSAITICNILELSNHYK